MKELTNLQKGILIIAAPFLIMFMIALIRIAGWGALAAVFILAITVGCVVIGYHMTKQPDKDSL